MREGEGMRVLLSLHQGSGSGAVHSVVRLARGLAQRGLEVHLVCPPDSPVEAQARAWEIVTHPIPLAHGSRFTNARRFRDLLEAHRFDLINAHGSRDREALTWLALSKGLPAPFVITRRSWPRSSWLETRLAARVVDQVVVLSQPMIAPMVRLGLPADRIAVIENGVLLDRIDQPVTSEQVEEWRRRIEWQPGRAVVGIVARPKDQDVVLRALSLVQAPVHLVLAGLDGDALHAPLPAIPDRHRVTRLGFDPAIRPIYALLDLVLHPSRWDAFPQAVLEALALEKPVIASNATGNAVIIRHEIDGLLVPADDAGAWAAAIDRLLSDRGLATRLAASGKQRAREDFPFARTIDRTIELYRQVVARGRSR